MTDHSVARPEPLRAAIIGAGLMGRWHAHAVRRIGGKVSVIVDRDHQQALELSYSCPHSKIVSELSGAIGLADVAHICTPPPTHELLVRQALESGMHVLAEKPLAESSHTTEQLLGFAQSRGLLLCPVHQYLFQSGVVQIQKSLSRLGDVLHFDTVICSSGAESTGQPPRQLAAEILPGPLSLFCRFCGTAASGATWQTQEPRPGELRLNTSIDRTSASILISMQGRPTINSLRLIGERGTAHADLFHGFAIIETGKVSRIRKIFHPFTWAAAVLYSAATNLISRAMLDEPAYPGLTELIRNFYNAVQGVNSAPISSSETLSVALAREQIMNELHHPSLSAPSHS